MYNDGLMRFFEEMENNQESHGTITLNMSNGQYHQLPNQPYTNFMNMGNDVAKAKMGKHENGKIMGHFASGNEEVFIDLRMVASVGWEE